MAKIDRLKEEIGWLKVVFSLLVAIDVSIIGWTIHNFFKVNLVLLIVVLLLVVVITVSIIIVNRSAFKRMCKIGEL